MIDFGIARHFKPEQAAKDTIAYGSIGYAPPEQYGRGQTTPRSDIYSLGVLLYQLISGYDPASSPFRFPPLQSLVPAAPSELTTLIMQMLELNEAERPTNMLVVKQKLQDIAAPAVAPPIAPTVAAPSPNLFVPVAPPQPVRATPALMPVLPIAPTQLAATPALPKNTVQSLGFARGDTMTARLQAWGQKIKQHPFITVEIVVALLVIVAFTLAVYVFGWDWTGFTGRESKITITSTSKGITIAKELQPGKALWDWLGLLAALAIPVVVGIGAAWFTAQQAKVSDGENKDNQLEAALQMYIDKMSELTLKEHLGDLTANGELKPEYKHVRNVARVRTITVLNQLNARRIGYVFAFLREAGLMSTTSNDNAVSLSDADLRAVNWSQATLFGANLSYAKLMGANLSRANLNEAHLSYADLSGARLHEATLWGANLSGARLHEATFLGANLSYANLSGANLSGANLSGARLHEATLSKANLWGADLNKATLIKANLSQAYFNEADLHEATLSKANLWGADLSKADLSEANLWGTHLNEANLSYVDLSGANLKDAIGVTVEELEKQAVLTGATMPNGEKHP